MTRISQTALIDAITRLQAMGNDDRLTLLDALREEQPHLLEVCLVQARLGISPKKLEFLIRIVLTCFLAMRLSGKDWPLIAQADLEQQMTRFAGLVKFNEGLTAESKAKAMQHFLSEHPEPELLAYAQTEISHWQGSVTAEDGDQYVLLAVWTCINGIAYATAFPAVPAPVISTTRH